MLLIKYHLSKNQKEEGLLCTGIQNKSISGRGSSPGPRACLCVKDQQRVQYDWSGESKGELKRWGQQGHLGRQVLTWLSLLSTECPCWRCSRIALLVAGGQENQSVLEQGISPVRAGREFEESSSCRYELELRKPQRRTHLPNAMLGFVARSALEPGTPRT